MRKQKRVKVLSIVFLGTETIKGFPENVYRVWVRMEGDPRPFDVPIWRAVYSVPTIAEMDAELNFRADPFSPAG